MSLILDKLCLLKARKAGGHDGIQNENVIIYAGPDLAVHLCLLFNAMLHPPMFRMIFGLESSSPCLKINMVISQKPRCIEELP